MAEEEEEPLAWSEPFAAGSRLARVAGLHTVDRDWAWSGATGKGVTVAVIDSGVERDHPRVRGRLVESVAVRIDDEGNPLVEPDPSGVDLFGHGTACAGIIVGLAPDVEIISVRVLGADLKGKGIAFAAGLEWAIDRRVSVANLSLSSKSETLFPIFHELADDAYFNNVVLVSAANNVPVPSYPSLFASVISVAAHAQPDPFRF
jgi:subtilisin